MVKCLYTSTLHRIVSPTYPLSSPLFPTLSPLQCMSHSPFLPHYPPPFLPLSLLTSWILLAMSSREKFGGIFSRMASSLLAQSPSLRALSSRSICRRCSCRTCSILPRLASSNRLRTLSESWAIRLLMIGLSSTILSMLRSCLRSPSSRKRSNPENKVIIIIYNYVLV